MFEVHVDFVDCEGVVVVVLESACGDGFESFGDEWIEVVIIDDEQVYVVGRLYDLFGGYIVDGNDVDVEFFVVMCAEELLDVFVRRVLVLVGALLGLFVVCLQEGLYVFCCLMVEGFQKWIQMIEIFENLYMGIWMFQCGSSSDWIVVVQVSVFVDLDDIVFYMCGMYFLVCQDGFGMCFICVMDLMLVIMEEVEMGVIFVDVVCWQCIGFWIEMIECCVLSC